MYSPQEEEYFDQIMRSQFPGVSEEYFQRSKAAVSPVTNTQSPTPIEASVPSSGPSRPLWHTPSHEMPNRSLAHRQIDVGDHNRLEAKELVRRAVAQRRNQGMTQAVFAAKLGVNLRTWQEWEQGRRIPSGPARVLLAHCLK